MAYRNGQAGNMSHTAHEYPFFVCLMFFLSFLCRRLCLCLCLCLCVCVCVCVCVCLMYVSAMFSDCGSVPRQRNCTSRRASIPSEPLRRRYTPTYAHPYIPVFKHAHIRTHTHNHTFPPLYYGPVVMCVCVCMCECVCVCVSVCECVCVRVWVYECLLCFFGMFLWRGCEIGRS